MVGLFVSPLWLDGLGSEIDSCGFFVTLFFVKPSDDPVSLSKADPSDQTLETSCYVLTRLVYYGCVLPVGFVPFNCGLSGYR